MKKIIFAFLLPFAFLNIDYAQSGWTIQNIGTDGGLYSIYFINPLTGFAVGGVYSTNIYSLIYKTTNGGLIWTYQILNNKGVLMSICFTSMINGYMVGGENFNDTSFIYRTTNGGNSWYGISSSAQSRLNTVFFLNSNTGFAGSEFHELLKTTNAGETWIQLSTEIIGNIFAVYFVNANRGFASGVNMLYKTINGGYNWEMVFINSSYAFMDIDFVNQSTGYVINNNRRLYKTTNAGDNWVILNNQIDYPRSIQFTSVSTGYISCSSGLLYKSTDEGLNWHLQNTGVSDNLIGLYFINRDTGFAVGLNRVIIKTTNGGEPLGIQPISSEVPNHFSLSQNYPNPFNPVTKIKFDIPPSKGARGMTAQLIIYDILGREIATLVNQRLNPGSYEVQWDGINYPSGVYFYRLVVSGAEPLITEGYSETKRMVLLK